MKPISFNRYATLKIARDTRLESEKRDEHGDYIPVVTTDKVIPFALLERNQEVVNFESGARLGNQLKVLIRFTSNKYLLSGANIDDYKFVYNGIDYVILSCEEFISEHGRRRYLELELTKEVI